VDRPLVQEAPISKKKTAAKFTIRIIQQTTKAP